MVKNILFFSIIIIHLFSLPHVVLIGPPGSGKGTLSQKLLHEYPYQHRCIGDMLRQEIAMKSELGKKIANQVKKAQLIDTQLLFPLVQKNFEAALQTKKPLLIDGFIQSFDNILFLDQFFKNHFLDHHVVYFFLQLDRKAAYYRLCSRIVCSSCNYTHAAQNIDHDCPHCGGKMNCRFDDNTANFEERLDRFYSQVLPLLTFYENVPHFIRIDATQTPEKIFRDVRQILENHL